VRRSSETKLTPVGDVIRSLFPPEDAKERVRRVMEGMAAKESAKEARLSGRLNLREMEQRRQDFDPGAAAGILEDDDPFAIGEEE
jgi:hypothetical protein